MFKFQEKILIRQIRKGNQSAFTRLYNEYVDKIYRFIYFKVEEEEAAQDLTSQVFLNVLEYLTDETIESFQAFLYQTARNLTTDFYRNRFKEMPFDEGLIENLPDETNLENTLDLEIQGGKIKNALTKLPEKYREVIILRFIEGLPFKIISQVLQDNEDNLRVVSHRGLKMLKEILSQNL